MGVERDRYYVRFKKRVLGPITLDKAQELARPEVKKITPDSEMSTDGIVWKRAGEFPRLFDIPEAYRPKTILEVSDLPFNAGHQSRSGVDSGRTQGNLNADAPSTLGFASNSAKPFVIDRLTKGVKPTGIPLELDQYAGYEIYSELGHGGMGVVYLAKNLDLDRFEVLKVLSERLVASEEADERFMREIRAVSKLNHPAIVKSHSKLPLKSCKVFAMEYVDGEDLQKIVHRLGVLPVQLACTFVCQIAAGLQHAFELGLVHRDIKPSNVMVHELDGKMHAKILDFGLAKASSEKISDGLTQDGSILGTAEYIAPEQMRNAAKADIRADIYSLGCTLYHMLVGRPPFAGTSGEIMMAHAESTAAAVNSVRPEIPIAVSNIVSKMMSKDLSRRYQTPQEVIDALSYIYGDTSNAPSMESLQLAPNSFIGLEAIQDTDRVANSPTMINAVSGHPVDQFQTLLGPPPSRNSHSTTRLGRSYRKHRPTPWLMVLSVVVMLAAFISIIALIMLLVQSESKQPQKVSSERVSSTERPTRP